MYFPWGEYFFFIFSKKLFMFKTIFIQNKNFPNSSYSRIFALNKPKLTFMVLGYGYVILHLPNFFLLCEHITRENDDWFKPRSKEPKIYILINICEIFKNIQN